MKNEITYTVSAAILCLGLAAPAPAQETQQKPDKTTQVVIKDDTTPKVKQAGKAVSDASVTTAVKTRLMKDSAARAADIDVKTEKGVVTLSGAVPTAADKTRIGNLVGRTTGVKRVENELTVSGAEAGTKGTSGSDKADKDETRIVIKDDTTPALKKGAHAIADGSITTAVKTRLMGDAAARSTSIDVSTDDGVVTIKGTVPTEADKVRIGKLVGDTTGVKRVVNELKIGN